MLHKVTIVDDARVAAEVVTDAAGADSLARFLTGHHVEHYRYTRPGEFGAWRFES